MKTSDFPSYTYFESITQETNKSFRGLLFTNSHNSHCLITLVVENLQDNLPSSTLKIAIEKDGGTFILPLHISKITSISTNTGTLGTNVFVYGLS